MESISLARFLSLWMSANSMFNRSAMAVTLNVWVYLFEYQRKSSWKKYRLAPEIGFRKMIVFSFPHVIEKLLLPPASGLTTTAFLESGICNDIQSITAGSANRLSTGISKNPYWIYNSTTGYHILWLFGVWS